MAKKISWNRDIIPYLVDQVRNLDGGKVTPVHAHAVNSTISRVMYNVNCEARYFRARGEMPHIPFMHPPVVAKTRKTKAVK